MARRRFPSPIRLYRMASIATGGSPSRYRSQNPWSEAWTTARSATNDASAALRPALLTALLTKRSPQERAIGLLDQLRHPRFGARELPRRTAKSLDPFLKECQRPVERHTIAVQLGGNFLQPRDILLEGHGSVLARTPPSRSNRSNRPPGANCSTDVSGGPPSGTRATAYPRPSVASGLSAFSRPAAAVRRAVRRSPTRT